MVEGLTFKQSTPEIYYRNRRLALTPEQRRIMVNLAKGRIYPLKRRRGSAKKVLIVQISNIRRELLYLQVPLVIRTIYGVGYKMERLK